MGKTKWVSLLWAMLLGAGAPADIQGTGSADVQDDLQTLTTWMCGSFTSAQQAKEDPDFLDIRLRMVRIWPERADGHWLYVEQAVAWSQNEPYRQRVYHVTREVTREGDELFRSTVFELSDPLRFAGAWRNPAALAALTPDSLEARPGCAIELSRHGEVFVGSTPADSCESTLRGAAYATSQVEIGPSYLVSWDRGFSSEGVQVWGSEKGGYIFRKNGTLPSE